MATTITKRWQNNVGCLNGGDRRGDLLDGSEKKECAHQINGQLLVQYMVCIVRNDGKVTKMVQERCLR